MARSIKDKENDISVVFIQQSEQAKLTSNYVHRIPATSWYPHPFPMTSSKQWPPSEAFDVYLRSSGAIDATEPFLPGVRSLKSAGWDGGRKKTKIFCEPSSTPVFTIAVGTLEDCVKPHLRMVPVPAETVNGPQTELRQLKMEQ